MTDTVNQDEINASRDLQEDTPQNRLRDGDLARILETHGRRESVDYPYLAEWAEIVENGYNLNIPRHVDTYEPEPDVDLDVVEGRRAGYLRELGL